jgi:hypothetical protein
MKGILADNDVEGFVIGILSIWLSESWREIWNGLGLSVRTIPELGLPRESSDAVIWRTCQLEELVLVTGNRNQDEADSLETVMRAENQADSLPILTLANLGRLARDRAYAELVAARLLEYLVRIDEFRGAGRLYVP